MKFEDDRETMPVFDESIFYPEEACAKLGFTPEDIKSIIEFFRWHMRQRELRTQTPRKQLIQVLRLRQKQLVEQKRLELFAELRRLEKLDT
jgi:hypothetical protein